MSDQGVSQSEPSIKDRIGAVLASSEKPQPEPEVEEAPQEAGDSPQEPEQQVPETPEPEAEAEQATPQDWVEVELDGDTLQVPPKWQKAFLQEKDYTQKRQADADRARIVDAREKYLHAREQSLNALQPLYGQSMVLNQTIAQLERLDWDSLRANDPVEYSTKRADYAAFLQQRHSLQQNIEQGHAYMNQQSQAALGEQLRAAEPLIRKAIPDWGPEKDQQLTHYAINHGAPESDLFGLAARPWAIAILDKARKYDELQASRAQLPKKAMPSPVAKPGAKPTLVSSSSALYRKNVEQFRKSGGKDPASLRALIKAKLGT